jgi:hypothetical protein
LQPLRRASIRRRSERVPARRQPRDRALIDEQPRHRRLRLAFIKQAQRFSLLVLRELLAAGGSGCLARARLMPTSVRALIKLRSNSARPPKVDFGLSRILRRLVVQFVDRRGGIFIRT